MRGTRPPRSTAPAVLPLYFLEGQVPSPALGASGRWKDRACPRAEPGCVTPGRSSSAALPLATASLPVGAFELCGEGSSLRAVPNKSLWLIEFPCWANGSWKGLLLNY